MLRVILGETKRDRLSVLLIGAHADDIEIGCGGTILDLATACPALDVRWVVLSADGERETEARAGARMFLQRASAADIVVKHFRDGYFPYDGGQLKTYFEELKSAPPPDIIFTHYRDDWHQDHRLVGELTWNTWRNHLILEYEIPKYDPDLGSPNLFVPLTAEAAETKADCLMKAYASQHRRQWFTRDTFLGMMRLRGVASQSTYAEAFYARKLVAGFSAPDTREA